MDLVKRSFSNELATLLTQLVNEDKADGTTAISFDCMWAKVATRLIRIGSAPKGTNAAFHARETMREVIASNRNLKSFISLV